MNERTTSQSDTNNVTVTVPPSVEDKLPSRAVPVKADPFDNLPTVRLNSSPDLISRIMAIDPKLGGPDLTKLARIVVTAWERGLDGESGLSDFLHPSQHAGFEMAVEAVLPALTALVRAAEGLDANMLGIEGQPSERYPWAQDLDHVLQAALRIVRELPGVGGMQAAQRISEAARLLAGISLPTPPRARGGRPTTMHHAHMIARATCVYRAQIGLSYDCAWLNNRNVGADRHSPREDGEVVPISDTARLAAALRDALSDLLEVRISNASLHNAQIKFLRMLRSESRDPIERDLYNR